MYLSTVFVNRINILSIIFLKVFWIRIPNIFSSIYSTMYPFWNKSIFHMTEFYSSCLRNNNVLSKTKFNTRNELKYTIKRCIFFSKFICYFTFFFLLIWFFFHKIPLVTMKCECVCVCVRGLHRGLTHITFRFWERQNIWTDLRTNKNSVDTFFLLLIPKIIAIIMWPTVVPHGYATGNLPGHHGFCFWFIPFDVVTSCWLE